MKIEVDLFLRRYGAAFLSTNSIYLSDVISIDKEVLSAKLSLKLTLENGVLPHIAPIAFKEL